MSLTLYGFNVVVKRESLDRVIDGGSKSFIERAAEPRHGAASVTSDDNLVAVRFSLPDELEILVRNLLRHRLSMSHNGRFTDFAIVHAEHGLKMPCDWLEYERTGRKMVVWMKAYPRSPACFVAEDSQAEPVDPRVIEECPTWRESSWLTQVGHGFVLTHEDGYHAWLDFNTGRVIVNFLPGVSMAVQ
jgi:hypothetical protein